MCEGHEIGRQWYQAPSIARRTAMSNKDFPPKLSVHWLLRALELAGRIDSKERAHAEVAAASSNLDPISAIAAIELHDLIEAGKVWDSERLTEWLANLVGLPFQHIDPLKLDPAMSAETVSYGYARKAGILVVRRGHDTVTIACSDPFHRPWEPELETALKRKIQVVLANPADIRRFLLEFHSLRAASKESGQVRHGGTQVLENLVRLGRRESLNEDDQHIVGVVDWLLQYAFENRASDIHLEPRRETGHIRLRIDGELHEIYRFPENVFAAVCSRLKILGGCNLVERRKPQDGRIKSVTPEGGEVELRLSTLPTAFGEKLVLRIFDPGLVQRSLDDLGMEPEQVASWKELCQAPHGLILVTGPTGSGKTTTLYATLHQLASPRRNICTVEDPIELIEPRINQTQVNPQAGLSFAGGLRALLRQDPDVLMVGEIRDQETTEVALQAALTGHLVLATLHTNTAVGAIIRLLELGAPSYLLRATLLGVLAQRLVRKLCPDCKTHTTPDSLAEQWKALGSQLPPPPSLPTAQGCLSCRETGYRGRMGLYEVLVADRSFRDLIRDDAELGALEAAAQKSGLRTLRDASAAAIHTGQTSLDEAIHNILL